MADNNYIFPDSEELERIYLEKLNNAGKSKETPVQNDPIDAHKYKDPEKASPEVFDKMVSEIEKKRSERNKSYWTDTPVNPAEKSVWLDNDEKPEPRQEQKPQPQPEQKAKPNRSTKRTIEIKLSDDMKRKLGGAGAEQKAAPVSEEAVRSAREPEPIREEPRRPVRQPEESSDDARRTAAAIERVRKAAAAQLNSEQEPRSEDMPPRPPRKRKKPKFKRHDAEFSFINAAVCIVMVFGIGIALLVMKRASGFIESENRNLAEFPTFSVGSYFDGDFTSGIVNYYTDTIPGREGLRSLSKRFTDLFGIKSDDVEIINNNGSATTKETVDEEKKATTTKATLYTGPRETTTTEASNSQQATESTTLVTKKKLEVPNEGEMLNNVLVSGRGTPDVRAMSIFGGIFDIGTRYANVLNQYKQMVGETVNVYNMSVPLASAFYTPKNMEGVYSDQHECIENIGVSLNNVINVDVFDTLRDHADEYIYFRTDHHWQPLGAYYAAQQFAEEAQVPFRTIDTYEKKTIENFTGSMYGYTNYLEDLKTYPDLLTYYKPTNDYSVTYYDETFSNPYPGELFFEDNEWTQNYSVILGGDMNIAEIETDVHNGRTLVLIKNSYGNALVPFFVGSFEKIYVVDFRYVLVGMNDFFKKVGATDVLFGMAIFSCYSDDHIDMIENIMY